MTYNKIQLKFIKSCKVKLNQTLCQNLKFLKHFFLVKLYYQINLLFRKEILDKKNYNLYSNLYLYSIF